TMPTIPLAEDDGIVIDPRSFGTIGTASTGNYNKGKTLTHELGHYFGLLHTWGSIPDECSEDDGIIDTPQQYSNYVGCPTFPQYSCNTSDMFMNFMDYCHDECLRMFTPQQVERMKQVLFIYRTELLTSKNTVCQQENYSKNEITEKINVFPNPAFDKLAISFDFNLFQSIPIEIFNAQGKMVYQTLAFPPTVLTLPTTNWVAGAYIIRIKINSNNFIKKFIKK
ncbi:MAG: zinc-dependent metalloprotease, partial [Saprospiraceae bacterium]